MIFNSPWDRDVEVGGVVFGRFECSGIRRRDTGRDLFIRRIFASDRGGEAAWRSTTTPSTRCRRSRCARGASRWPLRRRDPGVVCGCIHSHPGIDRQRQLSDTDISSAAANARNAPAALAGKPFVSILATAGEGWLEGMPLESSDGTGHSTITSCSATERLSGRTSTHTRELEWVVEEKQRELLTKGGD